MPIGSTREARGPAPSAPDFPYGRRPRRFAAGQAEGGRQATPVFTSASRSARTSRARAKAA